jgi:type I restriction enzyme S subunit
MLLTEPSFQIFDIKSHWLLSEEKRIDAGFYAKDVIASRVLMTELEKKGIDVVTIEDFSKKLFWPGRFKRRYVSRKQGNPFLMPSEVIMFLPKAKKFIIDYPEEVSIEGNWLLITRSGSIGRCLIATKLLQGAVLSDDLIRIIPKDENNVGYLYAYLNTWMGQAFLTKDQYGATVKHIEPHHVGAIPIPRIPELEEELNQKIFEARSLREEAQEHLLKAEEMLHSELGLPEIDEDDVEYFGGERERIIKAFEIKASKLNLRLDASYHIPLFHLAIQKLMKAKSGTIEKLEDVADSFVPPRFKRAYVKDSSDGVPLIQGTHIPQSKPQDMKYIWKKMKNLNLYIVRKNWILTTCSGTIGRLSLVRDYWDKWAATNHLLRIIPDEGKIHPGYLAAFLLSIYGQVQFQCLIYGGVVDEIGEAGELFNEILLLKPKDRNIENEIGDLVFEAYDKRDKANLIEDETIGELERRLKEAAG